MNKRCFRCNGIGSMYQVANGFSMSPMGGKKVKCPLCLGSRVIEFPENEKQSTQNDTSESESEYKTEIKEYNKPNTKKGRPKKNQETVDSISSE